MKSIDADGSGVIDYTEFLASCYACHSPKAVLLAFAIFACILDSGHTCHHLLVHRCAQAATLDRKHYMEDRWSFKRWRMLSPFLTLASVLFAARGLSLRKMHAGKPSVFSIAMVMEQSAKKSRSLSNLSLSCAPAML